ncbi:MAG: hypothetical protein AAFZ91_01895 [Pseudomonadota bacterium]
MTDTPAPTPPGDSDPIDAEFEPATKAETEGRGIPGLILAAVGLAAALSLGALLFINGLLPGFGPSPAKEDPMAVQLDALQSQIEESEVARANLRTALSAQQSAADSTKNAIATLVTRLDGIERSLSDLRQDNEDLRETLSEIQVIPSSIATDPETGAPIGVPVNPLILERLENLENALTVFPDASPAPAAETEALNAEIASLREALAALDNRIETELAPAAGSPDPSAAEDAALALSAIEAAARRGRPFLISHQKLVVSLPNDPDVQALETFASVETPTLTQLQTVFSGLEDRALDADAKAQGGSTSWLRTILGDAVTVRREGEISAADQIDIAREALVDRDLKTAIEAITLLPPDVQVVFTDWLQDARQRFALEEALEGLRLTMIAKDR